MRASSVVSVRTQRIWSILRLVAAILAVFFILAASCGPTRDSQSTAADQPAVGDSQPSNVSTSSSLSPSSPGTSSANGGVGGTSGNSSNPSNSSNPTSDTNSSSSSLPNPSSSTTLPPDQLRLASIEARVSTELAVLERRTAEWLPHVTFGIAVQLLEPGGNLLGIDENESFVSASAAKPYWMTSAIAAVGLEAVEPHASAILCLSNNAAAGSVIDTTGIDAINEFLHNTAGMNNTFLLNWSFSSSPPASEQWMSLGRRGFNTTTTRDAATFYRGLYSGDLLEAEDADAMLAWMAESADCGPQFTKPLASRLPEGTQIWHKSGWLPPGCCTVETATLNDFGIVEALDATTYSIALATSGGAVSYTSYIQQSNFMAYASCRIYTAITSEQLNCDRPDDRNIINPGSPPTTVPAVPTTVPPATVPTVPTIVPPATVPTVPTTVPPATGPPATGIPPIILEAPPTTLSEAPPTSSETSQQTL